MDYEYENNGTCNALLDIIFGLKQKQVRHKS